MRLSHRVELLMVQLRGSEQALAQEIVINDVLIAVPRPERVALRRHGRWPLRAPRLRILPSVERLDLLQVFL